MIKSSRMLRYLLRLHMSKTCKHQYLIPTLPYFFNNFKAICSQPTPSQVTLDNPVLETYFTRLKSNSAEQTNLLSEERHVLSLWLERQKMKNELIGLATLEADKELEALAEEEKLEITQNVSKLDEQILDLLLPQNNLSLDPNSLVIEISAGVGGQEAMLFASELLNMYENYVAYKGWNQDKAESDTTDIGGLRHGSLIINGTDAFTEMKHEGGVHRVQRVPKTEKSGRLHTSTVTVAVLPRPTEVAIVLNPKDLKIETKRSSGAGGQHVNTTDSCVRITHFPSGLIVECQTERSQVQNRAKAISWLRARLYQRELNEQQAGRRDSRKQQVGSSLRSEKIRTYNFLQDRVTDHRIGVTMYNLKGFLNGGESLEKVIYQLAQLEKKEQLQNLIDRLKTAQ